MSNKMMVEHSTNTELEDKQQELEKQHIHENKTEKIRVLVTPSLRKRIDQYLGDIPKSVWFAGLAEREIDKNT